MAHHFTKNTVSAAKYCNKCGRRTQHQVFGGRIAHCQEHAPERKESKSDPKAIQNGFDFRGKE